MVKKWPHIFFVIVVCIINASAKYVLAYVTRRFRLNPKVGEEGQEN